MKKFLFIILILFVGNATASSLPGCPSDPSAIWNNCFGSYTYSTGDKYVGEWKDNKQHGQGTTTWADGDKYVGEWKDAKKHGQGTYFFGENSDWAGDVYVGEWRNDNRIGQGVYTYVNGDKYVGEFKDNKIHGQGTYNYASGAKYVGEYKDHKMHGQGTYTYPNGVEERGYHMNDEFVPTICENMGLTKGSDPFGNCVIELIKEINKDE